MKNKRVKQMICDCIESNYGNRVAEWSHGQLKQSGWYRPFNQGVFHWFGSIKDIK
ncbi:hypothetical protein [Vibrio viridaestus]|uniref:hypothetical protein n=1 Tax=Vibrio viridaestus TaxID=2487322 RepID=UPI00140E140C|nr:hypothetical protein [Vibrio viridaestus]